MTLEEPAVNKVATHSAVRKIHGKNINVMVSAKSIGDYHNITDEIVDPPDLPTTGLV